MLRSIGKQSGESVESVYNRVHCRRVDKSATRPTAIATCWLATPLASLSAAAAAAAAADVVACDVDWMQHRQYYAPALSLLARRGETR